MEGIISLCVRRPVTVIMAIAALVIAAIFSLSILSLNRLPDLSLPRVTVETVYPGMATGDVRSLVTIPVEDALSPVKGLERMRSVSRDGSSLISLDFRWGTDPMSASAQVREAVDAVYPALPDGIRKPVVTAGDSGTEPHAIIAVRSLSGDRSFTRRLAEYELCARLRKIDGAGSVILVGGELIEERLRLDAPRLAALGFGPPDFVRLLSGETADIPAGNARDGDRELVVVTSGKPDSAGELSELILPAINGPLRVNDAGTLGPEPGRRESVFVVNGREAVALEIYRRPGADPLRLSRGIRKTLTEAVPLFARDAEISLIRDSAPSLIRGVISLGVSAALGAAAVTVVLLIFIRRLRISLLAALSIPVSAAAGVCVLALSGRSLNSMSLGGLTLGIGLVSDTAVIVLDLLSRAFGIRGGRPEPDEIAARAASIAGSSMASTLTTAVVFVPVIFLPGPLGSLFGDTAIALVASIAAGWIYAQFCVPSLYLLSFQPQHINTASKASLCAIEHRYRRVLAPVLRNPKRIFWIAVLSSVAGGALLLLRPAVFISPDEAEEVTVSIVFPPGTMLENVETAGAAISRTLSGFPGIAAVYGRAGAEEADVSRRADSDYRREELILRCVLERGVKPEKVLAAINAGELLPGLPPGVPEGTRVSVSLPADRTAALLGLSSEWTFAVRGKDREETAGRAELAANRLRENTGFDGSAVRLRPQGARPELRLYPNREASAYLGMSAADIAETLYTLNEGMIAARLEIEGRPLDVRVLGNAVPAALGPELFLEQIPLRTAEGKTVYLGSLGSIVRREAEAVLARLDRSDVIYLDIPPDRSLAKTIRELKAWFSWFSRADESVFSRYRDSLLLNLCLVLILLYMTMGAQFESFLLPLILMLTIPFSLAGAGPALLIFGSRPDSGAVLGLTALFGLVVNNGLILFEISEEKIHSGCRPAHAVYGGSSERLRPVLITTATTVFALLPLALNPMGSSQKSMAAAMLGGLAVSALLSLFVLPPVFIRFFTWRERR